MNKKGVTDIKLYIISFTLFTFMILGGLGILTLFRDADSSFINDTSRYSEFESKFNQYSRIETESGKLQASIEQLGSEDVGVFGFLNALIGSAWNTIKLTFSNFAFIGSTFLAIHTFFGIPLWIPSLIIMIFIIIIVFAFWKAIFQVN